MATPRLILDRPDHAYELRWCDRAEAKLSSLDRPPTFSDLSHKKRSYYALCSIVWASIVEKNHRFIDPEDLAEYLSTREQVAAAMSAVQAMLVECYPPDEDAKKKDSRNNNSAGTIGSSSGPTALSTSGSPSSPRS